MRAEKREPNDGRKARSLHRIAEASDILLGQANPYTGAKYIGGKLADSLHRRRAARDYNATIQTLCKTRALYLTQHQIEDLVHSLVDDVREHLALDVSLA